MYYGNYPEPMNDPDDSNFDDITTKDVLRMFAALGVLVGLVLLFA